MAQKKVFYDESGHELTFHINHQGLLFLMAGDPDESYYNGYVCLDKDDVTELIKDLRTLLKFM